VKIEDVDLLDFDRFQRQEHHEMLAVLRETDPGIHFHPEPDGPGFWAVTRIEHLREVNRHPELFSSNLGGTQLVDNDTPEGQMMRDSIMLDMDPPKHTRYRKLVNRGFTPRMIGLLEAYLENRTRIIVDRVSELGECDFVTELSAELPLQAIAEMMGVPLEDRGKIFDWTNRIIGSADPDFASTEEEAGTAMAELYAYSHELQMQRRDTPADDIVTTLLGAEIDGDHLSEFEFDTFFLLLCVAGNETTRNTISHGMHAFMTNPEQWQAFLADPEGRMDLAMEEVLRWATPVLHFRRTCTQDLELGGVKMKAGDKVVMWHIAANRDPRAFAEPYTFDISRSPNDHIAFGGGGPHFCLGANLARMEMRLMFRELAARTPDMQLAGDLKYLRSNFIGGVKAMPVRFSPTPSSHTAPMERLGGAHIGSGQGYGSR
jgi:cholest-4-en-3-one 26-monooxygenase